MEIIGAFSIPRAVVCRHLLRLQTGGLVRTERIHEGRGCPADFYLLTELGDSSFPKVYDRFFTDLIRNVALLDGNSKPIRLVESHKRDLMGKFARRMAGKRSGPARVQEAVAVL